MGKRYLPSEKIPWSVPRADHRYLWMVKKMNQNILEMKGINKAFGDAKVLKNVRFELQKGEVHALVGGNGAGKSTLMKIMTGVYTKDSGEMRINGEVIDINEPSDAKKNGIAMIFQEMSLIQTLTVAENIFLGSEIIKNGFRDEKAMKKKAEEVLKSLGIDVEPTTRVSELSVGMSQMVEIAKAVSRNAKILVFDEPSAALSDSETVKLFELIRRLKKEGVSMVYISHRMNEILENCDRVTVLRDGQYVATEIIENLTLEKIVALMMGGEKAENKFVWMPRTYDETAADVLTVKHLKVDDKVSDISFSLKPGEILGFAGLMGSGRTEIMETLFGIRKRLGGTVHLNGEEINIKSSADAVKKGIALIPEDRRKEGLVLSHTIRDNVILPIASRLTKKKIMNDDKQADQIVCNNIKDLNIVAENMDQQIGLLSGGNQQKVVIAKWLNSNPKVMMLDEPTAGVDIGAKGEIIQIVRKFADRGGSVLFASSELAEMMAVCDKIITIYDGHITGEIKRSEIKTEEELQHAIQRK